MTEDLRLYRRMRGIFWGLLVVGVVTLPVLTVLVLTVPAQLELYSSSTIRDIGTAGAVTQRGLAIVGVLAALAAVIIGATAGSVDLQRGVLRDLVVAGRQRWRIVLGRLAGGSVLLLIAVLVGAGLVAAAALAFAPVDGNVDWERVAREGLSFVPGILTALAFATGVALLIGSRGPAIAVYFVFALVIDNVLQVLPKVGEWWQRASMSAAEQQVAVWVRGQVAENPFGAALDRSSGEALAVLVAWAVVPVALGIVRLTRRDL